MEIESILEMKARVKQNFPDIAAKGDEAVFLDEFSNGEFHEESVDWRSVARQLSPEMVESLTRGIIKVSISGSIEGREGAPLRNSMQFYEAVRLWYQGRLKNPNDVLEPIIGMAANIAALAKERKNLYFADALRALSLVDMAIRARMGLDASNVESKYDSMLESLFPKS